MIGTLGWQELLIILVILALLFGATRVRDLGGALGSGIREFRREARREGEGDDDGDGDGDDSDDGEAATAESAASSSDRDDSGSSG